MHPSIGGSSIEATLTRAKANLTDNVLVPVHVSFLENTSSLPWPQPWVALKGKVTSRYMHGRTLIYEILIYKNAYLDKHLSIRATDDEIELWTETDEFAEIDRIIDSRKHSHNRGNIRCDIICTAKLDYFIYWSDSSSTWVPDSGVPEDAVTIYKDQNQYRCNLLHNLCQFFFKVVEEIEPSDKSRLAEALSEVAIQRVKHVCRKREICVKYPEDCAENNDYTITFKNQTMTMLASYAPFDHKYLKEVLKKLPPEKTDNIYEKPTPRGKGRFESGLLPGDAVELERQEVCNYCKEDMNGNGQSFCVACFEVIHTQCGIQWLRNPNRIICDSCSNVRCSDCLESCTLSTGMKCMKCKFYFCKNRCVRSVHPPGDVEQNNCRLCYPDPIIGNPPELDDVAQTAARELEASRNLIRILRAGKRYTTDVVAAASNKRTRLMISK